jgi:hypothetical protein
VPLKHEPGGDLGHAWIKRLGGSEKDRLLLCAVVAASVRCTFASTTRECLESFWDGHVRALAFSDVPKILVSRMPRLSSFELHTYLASESL